MSHDFAGFAWGCNGEVSGVCSCGWGSAWYAVPGTAEDEYVKHRHEQKDAQVEDARTGKQSDIKARFDLIDPGAIAALARVLHEGAKVYGEGDDNWRRIPVNDHLNHAVAHVYKYLEGDTSEDHLPHAFCRLMFAVALAEGS